MLIVKATERYLRYHRAEGSTAKTLEWHRTALGQLAAFLVDQGASGDVDDLSADDLRQWIDALRERGLAQSSVATYVRSAKAFGKWLAAEEYLNRDPFARVGQPKVDDKPHDTLTPDDVGRLLATCDRKTLTGCRDYAVMLLLFSTGLRASELLSLTLDDLDEGRGLITVRRGKGGRFRVVPLSRPVERAIARYVNHPKRPDGDTLFLSQYRAPLSVDGLEAILRRRGKQAGIHANPHKWRHSSAVQYLRNGGRVEVLQAMLGHTDIKMTLHYARIAGVDVTTAHDTADPLRALRIRV